MTSEHSAVVSAARARLADLIDAAYAGHWSYSGSEAYEAVTAITAEPRTVLAALEGTELADYAIVRRDDLEVLIMFAIASFKGTTRLPSAVTRLQEALSR